MNTFNATARLAPEEAVFRPALLSRPIAGSSPEKMMATYWEKLKDPRWQRRRLEIMALANFTCEQCESSTKTLNVHHKLYRKRADPWDYADHELCCLCENCHEQQHALRDRLNGAIARGGAIELEITAGFAEGFYWCIGGPNPTARIDVLSWGHAWGIASAFGGIDPNHIIDLVGPDKKVAVAALHALRERHAARG